MGTLVVGDECYEVVATVGKGTFGEVTQGWRKSTGEMVAIKILKNEGHHGQVAKNELRLLQALREVDAEESHVVRFLESFSDGAWTYLVFELLEQNLFDFQKQNNFMPLPVRHIRTITAQVLEALVKLKELSIIHADLKPENIMLVDHARYPFHVKLIDFGSASTFPDVRHLEEPYIQSRFYRAPEILLGLPFCEKVDIWSLGCVMAELHLGWPLYPGIDEYDQVRYICSTLGLPRGELLCAARKTRSFFRRVPHPAGSWQLKPPSEETAKPTERRKFIFSSLDQLAAVNGRSVFYPGREALAERRDLEGMVELVKRMITWDSHERITPSAALKHPFVSLQQVKSNFEATRYYQLCQEDLRASRKAAGAVEVFPGAEEGAFIPGIQKVSTQMDGLNLSAPVGDTGDTSQQDAYQAPIPTHYGARRHHQPGRRRRPEPGANNVPVLGFPGRRCDGGGVFGDTAEQNPSGRPQSSPRTEVRPPAAPGHRVLGVPWVLRGPQVPGCWGSPAPRRAGAPHRRFLAPPGRGCRAAAATPANPPAPY